MRQLFFSSAPVAFVLVSALSACSGGASSSSPVPPAADNAVVTSSFIGASGSTVSVVVGGSAEVIYTVTTSDGQTATNFQLTGLDAPPAGWYTGTPTYSCASFGTGNGCQFVLSYSPTAYGSGTLGFSYSYTDAAGNMKQGTISVPYAATTNDNAVVTSSWTSNVYSAVVGQPGRVFYLTVTTDDGEPASGYALTGLASLPAGWTAQASAGAVSGDSFSCAAFSTGSSCILSLTYAPSAASSGSFSLPYTYNDDAGSQKAGTLTLNYAGYSELNTVDFSVSPAGQIAVTSGGSQSVQVTFTSSDANPLSGLAVTGLGALPVGWSGPAQFQCDTVDGSGSCTLNLTYAPTSPGGSLTLSLPYTFDDDGYNPRAGTVTINYKAN